MMERRRFMRFRADLEAEYQARGSSSAAGRAQVWDFSREGMRVAVPHPLSSGERVEFTMRVPGDTVPIVATGEVAWAMASGIGIRFQQIKPLDLARMLDYLYARWLGA